jgi:cytochrome c-type biogenesis protein
MIEVTVWAALLAGFISFISPCMLPVVPTYLAAMSQNKTRGAAFFSAMLFVFGFSAVFIGLGALAGFFSFYWAQEAPWIMQAAGVIVIIFGGQMLLTALDAKWARNVFSFLYRGKRFHVGTGNKSPIRFGLLGLAFGFGWTPCIGPILSAILALAYSSQTASQGAVLLAVYSFGLGVPFIISVFFIENITKLIRKMGNLYKAVEIVGGLMLIGLGILILTNSLIVLNAWFYSLFS